MSFIRGIPFSPREGGDLQKVYSVVDSSPAQAAFSRFAIHLVRGNDGKLGS